MTESWNNWLNEFRDKTIVLIKVYSKKNYEMIAKAILSIKKVDCYTITNNKEKIR